MVELVRLARARYEPGHVLLAAGSMGGTAALIFASRHPDVVDAVLAWGPATDVAAMHPRFPEQFRAAYGGSPEQVPGEYRRRASRAHAEALAKLPVVVIHGSADAVIRFEHARTLVQRLQALRAPVRLIEVPGGDHDAPSPRTSSRH